ncbi:MAG: hypothetical protein WBD63_02940 [Phycisphaerae bacterium]|nr:hypothetical protein [Phycisphaerae bacterium]
MGDTIDLLTSAAANAACRAMWTGRAAGEDDLPQRRIVHARAFRPGRPVAVQRLGLRRVPAGYVKCGSLAVPDWITSVRVHACDNGSWGIVLEANDLPEPKSDEVHWFNLDGLRMDAMLIEARRCAVDLGWTGWNLVNGALILEGDASAAEELSALWHDFRPVNRMDVPDACVGRGGAWLACEAMDLSGCPAGVAAVSLPGEVRYRTRFLEVGFRVSRAGFSYLDIDDEGLGRTHHNLLSRPSVYGFCFESPAPVLRDLKAQGLRLRPVGGPCAVGLLEHEACGTVQVCGNRVTYDVEVPRCGQRYRLAWEVLEDRLRLEARRTGERPLLAWDSSLWHISLSSGVTPTASLGRITREGEAGLIEPPVLLHAPGHGTLRVQTSGDRMLWRSDSWRPTMTTTAELKLGETPTAMGLYELSPGEHRAAVEWVVTRADMPLRSDAPAVVRRAVERCAWTSLTYRPDTATLSNNANSIHGIICADSWSAVATKIGPILPHLDALDLLRDTLDRWLDGGPSYGGGRVVIDGKVRYVEDEYIMTGAAALLGLADYLAAAGDPAWVGRHAASIRGELDRMRQRDLDADGLVESDIRLGISGQHQWSTSWYDVISFGWKDAFSNALLYPALVGLHRKLTRLGYPDLARGLDQWAGRLRQSYTSAFFNPQTGWLGGWRSKDGQLHDYGFLFVNGAAVVGGLIDDEPAERIIRKLWHELGQLGPTDYRFGLPGNLLVIPYDDMAIPMPEGVYQNHTLNLSQSRHFLGAMYRVGLQREADGLLSAMMGSLADGSAFAGCGTGVDWRRWDGMASGYEGLLSDQFGVLAVALDRYAARLRS